MNIIIGDMHVKKNNIEESFKLWSWIIATANKENAKTLTLLGDIFNDFGVTNIEVLNFWINAIIEAKSKNLNMEIIVGNHDMSPDGLLNFPSFFNSLGVKIYDCPEINENYMYIPFIRNSDEFIKIVNNLYTSKITHLFCHQEFNGCMFENGFYAPHGVDPNKLPSSLKIISGHIHMRQEFGNIFYPGTPRALTKSDANQEKGIYFFKNGDLVFYKTPDNVIPPTLAFEINSLKDIKIVKDSLDTINSNNIYLDIKGTKEFVSDCLKMDWTGIKVKTTIQSETLSAEIKESNGISKAFNTYFENYVNSKNINKKDIDFLYKMIKNLLTETVK